MKSINRYLTQVLMFNFALSFFCFVYADGMKVKPGLWNTNSVVTMPLGQGTQEHTSQDCIAESEVTPEDLMKDTEGCEILNANVDAKSMQWTISCKNAGVEMTGEGKAQSTGTTISGGMDISATYNGQEMLMSTIWEGTYVGDCN